MGTRSRSPKLKENFSLLRSITYPLLRHRAETPAAHPAGMSHTSPAQLAANRANAAHSTGPMTADGKANSSRNAVTTALTGRTVLLPSDDLGDYQTHLAAYAKRYRPTTHDQAVLVQSIADTDWRLARIPHLLLALQAKAAAEFADSFTDLAPAACRARIELETFFKYEKQIRSFQLQEARLHRRREKDIIELQTVQKQATYKQRKNLALAAELRAEAQREGRDFDPEENGFEFSSYDLEHYSDELRVKFLRARHTATSNEIEDTMAPDA